MPVVSSGTGPQPDPPRRRSPTRALLRAAGRSAVAICAGACVLLAAGFGWFLWRLPADEVVLAHDADGIVVLTGGASRISDAIELLAAGRGKRLLISGLNRATTSGEILRLNPNYGPIVNCCIDFDRSLNTLGNAIETRHWVESRGFRSLIVVTSNYHMPRAIAEIAHQLPEVSLLPFPVVPDKHAPMMRLVLSEYLKYVAAQVRFRFDGGATMGAVGVGASSDLASSWRRKSETRMN